MTAQAQRLPVKVDPLIGEAKQRMRRRRLLLAAVGVVAVAVGLTLALRPAGFSLGGRSGAWVPQGVQEVDVRAPNLPLSSRKASPPMYIRVTDPSQVHSIVAWFDGLTRSSHAPANWVCAGGYAENVTFTFRNASGHALATASSAPAGTGYCSPIQFGVGAQPQKFLYDADRANPLIGRVQQLLGVQFQVRVYYG